MRRNLIEAGIGLVALGLGTTACSPDLTHRPTQRSSNTAVGSISPECSRQGTFTTAQTVNNRLNFAISRTQAEGASGIYTLTIDIQGLNQTIRDEGDTPQKPLTAVVEYPGRLQLELRPSGRNGEITDNFRQGIKGTIEICNVLVIKWREDKIKDISWNFVRQN